jgi:hypothetical protein
MPSYLYDDLLSTHFQKTAFWGALARGAVKVAPTAAKAGLGYAAGIPIGAAGTAGMMARTGMDLSKSVTSPNAGPSLGMLGQKTGSLRESLGRYQLKTGSDGGTTSAGKALLHAAPYVAWLGSQGLDYAGLHRASKALNLGAYGLYAGMAGHEALTNPQERLTSGVDAAALAAMALSDIARMRRESQTPASGSH